MHRPRFLWSLLLVPTLIALTLTTIACGGFPEDQAVRQFFQASKMRDNMTLVNIATVKFDPQTDGAVDSFKTVAVTPEQAKPLEIKKLAQALQEAQAADQEFSKKKKEYQDANIEAIDRILKAESKGGKVTGKDAAVQAEWNKWRQETAESAKKVSEARTALNAEREVAQLSLPDRDVTSFDGTQFTKEVTVEAKVRSGGAVTTKKMVLIFQRAVLKGENGQDITGRWMITKLTPQ